MVFSFSMFRKQLEICSGTKLRRSGFTLAELVIASALIWILLVQGTAGLRQAREQAYLKDCLTQRRLICEKLEIFNRAGTGVASFKDAEVRNGGSLIRDGILSQAFPPLECGFQDSLPICEFETVPFDASAKPIFETKDHAKSEQDLPLLLQTNDTVWNTFFPHDSKTVLINCIFHGPYPVATDSPRLRFPTHISHLAFKAFLDFPVGFFIFIALVALGFFVTSVLKAAFKRVDLPSDKKAGT